VLREPIACQQGVKATNVFFSKQKVKVLKKLICLTRNLLYLSSFLLHQGLFEDKTFIELLDSNQ
jgi:hypothetical protein